MFTAEFTGRNRAGGSSLRSIFQVLLIGRSRTLTAQRWGRYGFYSSLTPAERWRRCFHTMGHSLIQKTHENPLDSKEIKPVNPKGNQPWILIGRTAAEAEAGLLWPPDVKSQLIGKDPDAGKDWKQKRATEDNMVRWHHWFNGHKPGQTPGWWGTGEPGMLQSMGLQTVGHDLVTE